MKLAARCRAFPPRTRRALALLAIPMFVASLWIIVVLPLTTLRTAQTEWRDEARDTFAQARDIEAAQANAVAQLDALRNSPVWARLYSAGTPGGGAAMLQSDVATLLSSVQSSAQTLTPIASSQQAELTRIGVRLTASLRINQLQGFLSALASHSRYARVDEITIVAPLSQSPQENPPLAVTMDVYAFERAHIEKPESAPALASNGVP